MWQGHKIGTVCVIDTKPRELTASLQQKLIKLAALAAGHMHTRLQARQLQEANAALRLQTERLHALIDTANAPIFAVDQQLRVSVWNNKIAELLSLPKRDAVGRKVDELGPLVGAEGGADAAPARAAGAEHARRHAGGAAHLPGRARPRARWRGVRVRRHRAPPSAAQLTASSCSLGGAAVGRRARR